MAKTTSNLATIKDAIIYAHDVLHNSRAIGKAEVEACNISEQAISQWSAYVEDLREASNNYLDISHNPDAEAKDVQAAQGRVWSEWRRVLKQGTEQEFDSRFFIRRSDITHICGLCGEKFLSTAKGKNLAHATKADFRKNIETLIGIRLTGNGMLSDEDRDTIDSYEKAVKAIKTNTDLLNGYKDAKGTKIAGLKDQLKSANADLQEHETLADELELVEEKRELFLGGFKDRVDQLKKQVEAASKKLKEAKETRNKTQNAYDEVMLTLRIAGAES